MSEAKLTLAVTGADGFVGWHVRCRAFALGLRCVPIHRATLSDPVLLREALRGVDAVIHCAGVNRGTADDVVEGNLAPARQLATGLAALSRQPRVVYANSVHAGAASAYGKVKREVALILARAEFSDVVLPNLFGEHGRPYYNSFVATFCAEIAEGRQPASVVNREIGLMHVQDAAALLVAEAALPGERIVEPKPTFVWVSDVLDLLKQFEAVYARGELPDISESLHARLFSTYRAQLFPGRYPIEVRAHSDARGTLVECVRTGATGGQAFASSTLPGQVRGEHTHLRKFERFLVLAGDAEIALRRLFTSRVVRFKVSGARPVVVDMPSMWLHKITNTGTRVTTTLFWSDELFRESDPDTFHAPVESLEVSS